MITVRHRETKEQLEIAIDSARFFLYDRTAEEIGSALFQAFQAGAWHALRAAGFRDDVAEAVFSDLFGRVDFDFSLPMEDRADDLAALILAEFNA